MKNHSILNVPKSISGPEQDDDYKSSFSQEKRPERRRVSETIRFLKNRESNYSPETLARPKVEFRCDHDHIEGQRIDIIDKKDRGTTEFKFKLRNISESMLPLQPIINKVQTSPKNNLNSATNITPSGAVLKDGQFTYDSFSSELSYKLCDAYILEKEGIKFYIAKPVESTNTQLLQGYSPQKFQNQDQNQNQNQVQNQKYTQEKSNHNDQYQIQYCDYDSPTKTTVRSAIGLVKIEAPNTMAPEEVTRILEEILEKDFSVPNIFDEVSEKAEQEYKMARYQWQHNLPIPLTPEQKAQSEKLEYKEVFPGYTTLIEKDKHKYYLEKYGEDLRAVHRLYTSDIRSIHRVLTKGLMSTSERFSRGLLKPGLSSTTDLRTGGADSVFTRISRKKYRDEMYGPIVVFKPEIFDRTDWYSYYDDTYGSTKPYNFSRRPSPDTLFSEISRSNEYNYPFTNEQMFRTGIGADYIESIDVDFHSRNQIIKDLRSLGLEEVNNRPIEEIIIARPEHIDKEPEPWDDEIDFELEDELSLEDELNFSENELTWSHKLTDTWNHKLTDLLEDDLGELSDEDLDKLINTELSSLLSEEDDNF